MCAPHRKEWNKQTKKKEFLPLWLKNANAKYHSIGMSFQKKKEPLMENRLDFPKPTRSQYDVSLVEPILPLNLRESDVFILFWQWWSQLLLNYCSLFFEFLFFEFLLNSCSLKDQRDSRYIKKTIYFYIFWTKFILTKQTKPSISEHLAIQNLLFLSFRTKIICFYKCIWGTN